MQLRDAIIDFLERKGKDSPEWEEIKAQPQILACAWDAKTLDLMSYTY